MPEEVGQDSEGSMEIAENDLSCARWIAIFDAVKKGTFDNEERLTQFILDERPEAVTKREQSKLHLNGQGLPSTTSMRTR